MGRARGMARLARGRHRRPPRPRLRGRRGGAGRAAGPARRGRPRPADRLRVRGLPHPRVRAGRPQHRRRLPRAPRLDRAGRGQALPPGPAALGHERLRGRRHDPGQPLRRARPGARRRAGAGEGQARLAERGPLGPAPGAGAPARGGDRPDRRAARLLPMGGETSMTGGTLLLDFDDAAAVVEAIAELGKGLGRRVGRRARREGAGRGAAEVVPVAEAVLAEAAPLITGTWLAGALEQARGAPLPELVNFDGEQLVLCEVRFPLADPARAGEVTTRLDRLADLHRDEPGEPAWTWTATAKAARGEARAAGRKALKLGALDAEAGPVLGSVRLEDDAVALAANSVERAGRGREMLRGALGTLVRAPLTSVQTPEQMLAERSAEGGDAGVAEPPLPPEEAEAVMREVMDQHYRGVLDEPVTMLDGKSPRQAARSKTGRRKVAEWLKYLENQTAHHAGAAGMPAYDFGWMWEELKVADLRR